MSKYMQRVGLGTAVLFAGITVGATAQAQNIDWSRWFSNASGVSGMATMATSLGKCDSPLIWGAGFDAGNGNPDADALSVSCSFYDETEEMDMERTVIGKFGFWDGAAHLQGMTYLP